VESGHHVLDIGCGWGTLAIRLVQKTGCKCTGITLSEEQLKYAKRKVKEAGLEVSCIPFLIVVAQECLFKILASIRNLKE
jgi:cyclopropane fatty-acyl-phospholipid synthase-like methyltransferase